MMRAMVLGVLGCLALATPAAASGITITAGVDVFLPTPGTTVVFSAYGGPEAVVVETGVYGTVFLEQRMRAGRVNHVRMNLRYPHRHRVRGVIVNDYVWVNGHRRLASETFRHYYAPRHMHAAYRHAHGHYDRHHRGHRAGHRTAHHSGHHQARGGHDGHTGRIPNYRDRGGKHDRDRNHDRHASSRNSNKDSCHEAGHPGRGHAYGKCKKADRDYAKAERKSDKEHRKAEREMEKERKKEQKAEKRNNGKGNGRDKNKNKGKGKRNAKKDKKERGSRTRA